MRRIGAVLIAVGALILWPFAALARGIWWTFTGDDGPTVRW